MQDDVRETDPMTNVPAAIHRDQPKPVRTVGDARDKAPKYRCHKIVQALEIAGITDGIITPTDKRFASFDPGGDYFRRHSPEPGGWWVRYADGYESYSPAEPFVAGYELIPGT